MTRAGQRTIKRNAKRRGGASRGSSNGSSLVELICGLLVAVPLVLTTIDLGVVAIGAGINDAVCRDAARAAAAGPPAGHSGDTNHVLDATSEPYQRARAVVKKLYQTNLPAKVREILYVRESLKDVPPAPQGGSVDGELTVSTTVDIAPFFLVRYMMNSAHIEISSRHTVPYTYVVPNTAPPST